ncbi:MULTISPECIES: hypothetical protein [Pontibacillus]|uniref:Uncharacterized protein n=1 Tax=Pontibacillus chungwhensis TaxID=265426 RepID=A0ABY8V102_9BACI|nr:MULTISPECIES: hypothetical protein [Pontibacillus]MCD5324531.1 hypothetical protein [Pontibacillus sp. HN14]WIF99173.1 hypothetical protein QNI29_05815 [Pontibacillus chungwhensis]
MWGSKDLVNLISTFLPPFSEIIAFNGEPVVSATDLDRDGIAEVIGAYYWQGEHYVIVLKWGAGRWQVASCWMDSSLQGARDQQVPYESFVNKDGIDLSSLQYLSSEKEKNMKFEEALKKEFQIRPEDKVRYYYNKVDLNDDGKPEVFVLLVGPTLCGTGGCSAAIFKEKEGEYALLTRFSVVNNPVIVSDQQTNGYRDILMNVYGGGIVPFFARLKYDGSTYPGNPSVQPKLEPGTKVEGVAIVADDLMKSPGIEISS